MSVCSPARFAFALYTTAAVSSAAVQRNSHHPVLQPLSCMPWMQVTTRVVDTSVPRTLAAARASVPRTTAREEGAVSAQGGAAVVATTPQRSSRSEVEALCAKASPRTAQVPSKRHSESMGRETPCEIKSLRDDDDDDEDDDDDDDDDDEERREWRTRMIFSDLLRDFYPRYGVPAQEEFGNSFKAESNEAGFSAFPEPGVPGVVFR